MVVSYFIPAGYLSHYGDFNDICDNGYWWSSSENETNYAWHRYLDDSDGDVDRSPYDKQDGFSVRCLRD